MVIVEKSFPRGGISAAKEAVETKPRQVTIKDKSELKRF